MPFWALHKYYFLSITENNPQQTLIGKLLFRSSLHNRDTINWQMRESELLFYTDLHWVGAGIPRKAEKQSKTKRSDVRWERVLWFTTDKVYQAAAYSHEADLLLKSYLH